MANYDEIITQASDHRTFLLENAEQQRLAHSLPAPQPHPLIAWIGRQLVRWGQQLQGEKQTLLSPVPLMRVSR